MLLLTVSGPVVSSLPFHDDNVEVHSRPRRPTRARAPVGTSSRLMYSSVTTLHPKPQNRLKLTTILGLVEL